MRLPAIAPAPTSGAVLLLAILAAACGDQSAGDSTPTDSPPGTEVTATAQGGSLAPKGPTIIRHDFGIVRHGAKVTVDIPVPVDTSRAMVPAAFSGDCTCVRGEMIIRSADGKERVAPGNIVPRFKVGEAESLLLRLTLDTSRREPADQPVAESRGKLVLQDLSTSDYAREVIGVIFTFGIDSPIEVMPAATLDFGALAVSQDAKLTLRLKPSFETPVAILDAVAHTPRIKCALRPDGDDTLLDVTFRTDRKTLGPFQDVIEATTDLEGYTLRIIVAGDVQEDLVALPMPILSLANFDFTKSWAEDDERFITIVDRNPNRSSEFAVQSVTDQDGEDAAKWFVTTLRAVQGDPKRCHLVLTYRAGYPKQEFRGTVTVQCGADDVVGTVAVTVLAFHKT